MRTEEKVEIQEGPETANLHCSAYGCPNRNSGYGVCEWHESLKHSEGFPKMTEFLKTSEYKQMSWLWQRLMCFSDYDEVDTIRPGLSKKVREHARLLWKKMAAFGIETKDLEPQKGPGRNEDASPRSYGLRMRHLVMRTVSERIDKEIDKRMGYA